ncbi:Duplicated hybrid motif [Moorella glycerini]|uniref:Stage II sporulation protein Q n=1 Tax=Neomoorella stamsii TaxID=1266720 RepID=A0A9X7J4Q0_9FIRM|nr:MULTISPECIES: M23 family metallopeptidase [Moorella]PRR76386.1 Stage II sporulation protein Q [Moorella stamsii]CEP67045.1 Duplicated hybrid motif [Moorella glycerini]
MRDSWDWEEIKGAPLGSWPGPGRALPPPRFPRRWLRQGIFAGLLWLALTILFRLDSPVVQPLQLGLRHYLADPAADYTQAVAQLVRSGMWLDAYDRWVFHSFTPGAGAVPVTASPALPAMAVPLSGNISRPYGWMVAAGQQYFHNGIDIQAPGGSTVRAALAGKVIRAGEDPALGLVVEIDHGRGLVTVYGTLGQVKVSQGQAVEKGSVIATLAQGPVAQLHFEVRQDGRPVDPTTLLTAPGKM